MRTKTDVKNYKLNKEKRFSIPSLNFILCTLTSIQHERVSAKLMANIDEKDEVSSK